MKKYVIRVNEKFLFDSFERSYVSALLGPRRVGKTTLVDYFISLHPDKTWVKLNMDILSQRTRVVNEELQQMIEENALQKIGGPNKIWVFIDEAQKCPELFDQIKVIYDTHKGKNHIKFIMTGSAHLNLHQLTAETLAGRVELLNLREFNLREIALLQNNKVTFPKTTVFDVLFHHNDIPTLNTIFSEMLPFKMILHEALDYTLLWGGLPEAVTEPSNNERLGYLGNYLQTYLEKDVRAIDAIGDLNLYRNLMKISAELTGSVRDDAKIVEALHTSRNTLTKYRNYLLATLQYIEIYPFVKSTVKRLVKSPKGYLINNGLISYLTGIYDLSILRTTGFIGHRLENWFLNEIQTWLDTQRDSHQINFWRTGGGAEVDFVITLGNQVIPFEITHSPTIEAKKIYNLRTFMKHTPGTTIGVLCYMGPLEYIAEHRILCLPAWII